MKNYYGQGTITKKAIQAQTRENKEKNQLVDSMNNDNEVDLENWQRLLERNLMDLDRPVTLLESDIPILIDFIKQLLAQKDDGFLKIWNQLPFEVQFEGRTLLRKIIGTNVIVYVYYDHKKKQNFVVKTFTGFGGDLIEAARDALKWVKSLKS